MKIAVCPGSFNPVTCGHLDIFERAAEIFDEVIILLVYNSAKVYDVSAETRIELLKEATSHLKNVQVTAHSGLLIDFALEKNNAVLVKGVRSLMDFEAEMTMAYVNKMSSHCKIETMLLPTSAELSYISSSIVREFASYGGDISNYVPKNVMEKIAKIYYKGERKI